MFVDLWCVYIAQSMLVGRRLSMAMGRTHQQLMAHIKRYANVAQKHTQTDSESCLSLSTKTDLSPTWDGLMRTLDNSAGLSMFAQRGAFNDLDVLQGKPSSMSSEVTHTCGCVCVFFNSGKQWTDGSRAKSTICAVGTAKITVAHWLSDHTAQSNHS